ncbi:MAG: periplasmic heavy metal sensor [Gemmatimonadaceae bacterium]
MSKIRSMMVGLLVVAGAAGVAEAQTPQRDREPRARREMGRGGKDRHLGNRAMRGLLRGITLTDAEKTNLRAVGERYRSQFETIRRSMRPHLEAARAARQRGDTAAARAAFARTADERAQLETLTERVRVDARAALAPEHRAQFDANVARLKERLANRRPGDGWGNRRRSRGERGEGNRRA